MDACRALGRGEQADTVALLVSELATNAILHSRGDTVRVRVLDRGPRLRVEVADDSRTLPVPRHAPPGAESGRGLHLIQMLAVDSGVEVDPRGKTLWFEMGA